MSNEVSVILAAGGSGRRMGSEINKVFLPLCGKTVIEHTVDAFCESGCADRIIIVTRSEDIAECERLFNKNPLVTDILPGGDTRQQSVYNGLRRLEGGVVLIHDAARALITPELIRRTAEYAKNHGSAALGVKCKDTLKSVGDDGFITGTVDRERVFQIQTPQAFAVKEIKAAHERAAAESLSATDDCALLESFGGRVRLLEGSYENIKLTTPEDIVVAERILRKRNG